ncbi:MAG: hypothetical protein JOY64_28125 [Alphaproteobacteria bacterium]|nr:hypothetical protein [Alphaproteobacteria bacterium]MBV8411527.1 hypothetical protein [Alphaproteobacteria bacterium]
MGHSDDQVRELRQRAARARYIAAGFTQRDDRLRIIAYAEELERQADALEAPTPKAQPVVHEQMQVQQQSAEDPKEDPKDD